MPGSNNTQRPPRTNGRNRPASHAHLRFCPPLACLRTTAAHTHAVHAWFPAAVGSGVSGDHRTCSTNKGRACWKIPASTAAKSASRRLARRAHGPAGGCPRRTRRWTAPSTSCTTAPWRNSVQSVGSAAGDVPPPDTTRPTGNSPEICPRRRATVPAVHADATLQPITMLMALPFIPCCLPTRLQAAAVGLHTG